VGGKTIGRFTQPKIQLWKGPVRTKKEISEKGGGGNWQQCGLEYGMGK